MMNENETRTSNKWQQQEPCSAPNTPGNRYSKTDDTWGPHEHAMPTTPDTVTSKLWNKYGHQAPETPASMGIHRNESEMQTPDSEWDRVTETPGRGQMPCTPADTEDSQIDETFEPTLEEWVTAITKAAIGNLTKVAPECKKDYIKKDTWEK